MNINNSGPRKRLSRFVRFVLRTNPKQSKASHVLDIASEMSSVSDESENPSQGESSGFSSGKQSMPPGGCIFMAPLGGDADGKHSLQSTEESEKTEESEEVSFTAWVEDQKKKFHEWAANTDGLKGSKNVMETEESIPTFIYSLFGCVPTQRKELPRLLIISDMSISDVSYLTFLEQAHMEHTAAKKLGKTTVLPSPKTGAVRKQRKETRDGSGHEGDSSGTEGYEEDFIDDAIAHQTIFEISEAATVSAISFGRQVSRFAADLTNDSMVAIDLMRKDFA